MKAKKNTPQKKNRRLSDAVVSHALNEAVQDAVEVHRRAGLPLAVWKDGKVALVSADEAAVKRNGGKPRREKPKS
ncbi:MAG: hypothetical protein ACKV0T_11985 [Planctomycetales bacterium]